MSQTTEKSESKLEKKHTILQILPELHTGGVERGTVEVATSIVQYGGNALVASAGGSLEKHLLHAGGKHFTLPLATKNPLKIRKNIDALVKLIEDNDVDIVHARSRAPAWSAYYAAKRTNRPFITTFHGVYGLNFPFKKNYNEVMVKGDRVIAVSNFVAEHIKQNYEMDESKLRVIHRGADTDKFGADKARPQRMAMLSKEWNIADNHAPIVLVPGRITRWKGQDTCIKALAQMRDRIQAQEQAGDLDFLCLLVGDYSKHPDYAKELQNLVVELGLEGRVRMVGNTEYMNEIYTMSHVVVCPSVEPEAFGRVPVEAQACGKPVIATAHGGACETVIDGETGWLVQPGNAEEMSYSLERALKLGLAENAAEYDAMAQAGVNNAHENFSTRTMCEKVLDVYDEFLG